MSGPPAEAIPDLAARPPGAAPGRAGAAQAAFAAITVATLGLLAALGSPIFLLVALVAVGFVTLVRTPSIGVPIILAAMLAEDLYDFGWRLGRVPITEGKLAVAVVLAAWGIHGTLLRKPLIQTTALTAPFLGVLLSMGISVAVGEAGRVALRDIASVALLATMMHALYAMLDDADLSVVFRHVSVVMGVTLLLAVVTGVRESRAQAGLGDPNAWAAVAILLSHVALGSILRADRGLRTDIASVTIILLYQLAVYQTRSRGGLLASALVLPFTLYGIRWRWRTVLVGLAGAMLVSPIVLVNVEATWARFDAILNPDWGNANGEAIDARVIMLGRAIEAFLAHPVSGVGLGNLDDQAAMIFPTRGGKDVHNSYAQVLGEQGLIGAITHGWLLWTFARIAWRAWAGSKNPSDARMSWFLGAGVLGYGMMQFTSGKLFVSPVGYFVATLVLCHARQVRRASRGEGAPPAA